MTIGIVGAGQLGRMMALAGYPLGERFLFLDRDEDTPGGQVAPILCGEFTDAALLRELARRCKVVTFDWENVPVEPLRPFARSTRFAPPLAALAVAQDRVREKRLFERLRIPTTRYAPVQSPADLERAVRRIGLPGVLKTRRLGYDGKGQRVIRSQHELRAAWSALGGVPLLYEELVPFDFEVSIIGARGRSGELAFYPLNANVHHEGILRLTRAPVAAPRLQRAASGYLRRILEHFRYVGILTLELFVRAGRLVANEMAPRVHNSGHWTIEGAQTSQFENHLRAILGLPLGSTAARGHAAMINIIGTMPRAERVLAHRGLALHDYGKEERPGRKLGHCTLVEPTARRRDRRARLLLAELAPGLGITFPDGVA
jgi:5-(carboxyamino)imidazole ribonucleotide synthase